MPCVFGAGSPGPKRPTSLFVKRIKKPIQDGCGFLLSRNAGALENITNSSYVQDVFDAFAKHLGGWGLPSLACSHKNHLSYLGPNRS